MSRSTFNITDEFAVRGIRRRKDRGYPHSHPTAEVHRARHS